MLIKLFYIFYLISQPHVTVSSIQDEYTSFKSIKVLMENNDSNDFVSLKVYRRKMYPLTIHIYNKDNHSILEYIIKDTELNQRINIDLSRLNEKNIVIKISTFDRLIKIFRIDN